MQLLHRHASVYTPQFLRKPAFTHHIAVHKRTSVDATQILRPLAWLGSHGLEPLLAKIFSQPMCDLGMDNSYRIEVVQNISEVGYLSLVEPY